MANMSDWLENALIDFLARGQSFSAPSSWYFALCRTTPVDASTGSNLDEPGAASGYLRTNLAPTQGNWLNTQGTSAAASTGTNGTTSNNAAISWATTTSAWGTINSIAICDATSGGNVLFWGSLSANRIINSGDTPSFDVGTVSLQIDN